MVSTEKKKSLPRAWTTKACGRLPTAIPDGQRAHCALPSGILSMALTLRATPVLSTADREKVCRGVEVEGREDVSVGERAKKCGRRKFETRHTKELEGLRSIYREGNREGEVWRIVVRGELTSG